MLTKLKPKSEFSKNVLTLMTGTTIAQAIPIAVSPIITIVMSLFEKQKISLIWQLSFLFFSVSIIYISNISSLTFVNFLYLFTLISAIYYLVLYFILKLVSRVSKLKIKLKKMLNAK